MSNGIVSDEDGDRFPQDIMKIENRYHKKWSAAILADFYWSILSQNSLMQIMKKNCKTTCHLSPYDKMINIFITCDYNLLFFTAKLRPKYFVMLIILFFNEMTIMYLFAPWIPCLDHKSRSNALEQ